MMASSEDDWQSSLTPSQRLAHLLQHPDLFTDITFEVTHESSDSIGDESSRSKSDAGIVKVFKAHKLILALASSVFEKMFFGPAAFEQKLVKITDVDSEAFDIVLRYIYTDDRASQLTSDNVMAVVYAAKKYALKRLLDRCEEFLVRHIAVEEALFFAGQARIFDLGLVFTHCCSLIDKNALKCLEAESTALVDSETLGMIIERDTLRIDELDLFRAVKTWASVKCTDRKMAPTKENLRKILGDLLYKIRFPLISSKEMIDPAGPASVLSDGEILELSFYSAGFSSDQTKFNTAKRGPILFTLYKSEPLTSSIGANCCRHHDSLAILSTGRPVTIHGLTVPTEDWEKKSFSVFLCGHPNENIQLKREHFDGTPCEELDGWTVCTLKAPKSLPPHTWAHIIVKIGLDQQKRGWYVGDATPQQIRPWLTIMPGKQGSRNRCPRCGKQQSPYGFIRDVIVE